MKRIILITGGIRSGKSAYAEKLALSLAPNPVYMATAHVWDEEFRQRVIRHQQARGPEWTNIEEEKYLSWNQAKLAELNDRIVHEEYSHTRYQVRNFRRWHRSSHLALLRGVRKPLPRLPQSPIVEQNPREEIENEIF